MAFRVVPGYGYVTITSVRSGTQPNCPIRNDQ